MVYNKYDGFFFCYIYICILCLEKEKKICKMWNFLSVKILFGNLLNYI